MASLVVSYADYSLTVNSLGARITSLTYKGTEITRSASESLQGFNGMVLAPWPNRIPSGAWRLGGHTYQLEVNEPQRNNALHGFALKTRFEVLEHLENQITLKALLTEPTGYPFNMQLTLTYKLNETGFSCNFVATNESDSPAPFGIGFHPYFPVDDQTRISIPAKTKIVTNDQMIPIGIEPSKKQSFYFGEADFDDCFTDPEREGDKAVVKIESKSQTLTLWQDEAFDFVMVYTTNEFEAVTGSNKAIAIEAQSCAANAFNTSPPLLAPGESFTGNWGLSFTRG